MERSDATSNPARLNRALLTSSALGFSAGYVDTVGFVALFGLFTAHVTGNFVLIGSELAHPTHGVLIKFLAFPAFIAAVAIARLWALRIEGRGASVAPSLLAMQVALLAACMFCGWRAVPIADAHAPWVLATGVLGAAAMGVQNAASKLAFGDLVPTTVMTGNVTQLVIDLVDLARGIADDGVRHRIVRFFFPLAAFAAGAICGALAYVRLSFAALGLPLAILAALAIAQRRRTSSA